MELLFTKNDHVLKGIRGIKGSYHKKTAYGKFSYRRMCATDQVSRWPLPPAFRSELCHRAGVYGSVSYRAVYVSVNDLNANGVLDKEKVNYTSPCGRPETNYEYNDFVDQNGDGIAQQNECYQCWDLNRNFKNDFDEDLNIDGIFNEVDCQVYRADVRHFNNIWTFALGCMFLYLVFSRYFFRTNQDLAFLAALLFTMHPIHSEAIAQT